MGEAPGTLHGIPRHFIFLLPPMARCLAASPFPNWCDDLDEGHRAKLATGGRRCRVSAVLPLWRNDSGLPPTQLHAIQSYRGHLACRRLTASRLRLLGLALKQASDGLRESLDLKAEVPPAAGAIWKVASGGPHPGRGGRPSDFNIGLGQPRPQTFFCHDALATPFYLQGLSAPLMREIKRGRRPVFARRLTTSGGRKHFPACCSVFRPTLEHESRWISVSAKIMSDNMLERDDDPSDSIVLPSFGKRMSCRAHLPSPFARRLARDLAGFGTNHCPRRPGPMSPAESL